MRFPLNPIFVTALLVSIIITLTVMHCTGYAPWQIYGHYR